jgi:hypothetical protein
MGDMKWDNFNSMGFTVWAEEFPAVTIRTKHNTITSKKNPFLIDLPPFGLMV